MQRKLPDARPAEKAKPQLLHAELTGTIIDSFYFTYNVLGFGFLESVYRKALALELRSRGLHVAEEYSAEVRYREQVVGHFRTELFVEHIVSVELKATPVLGPTDKRQLVNFLKAGTLDVGLLLHYGPDPNFYRLVNPRVMYR